MLKVVDAAWIADRALDLYAEETVRRGLPEEGCRSASVLPSVSSLFDAVYEDGVKGGYGKFDVVAVVVSCFPLMRVGGWSGVHRYLCRDERTLLNDGISPSQFLEFFERFVQSKSGRGTATVDGKCVWLKDRCAAYGDWTDALNGRFGSSLCDCARDGAFASNPGFIIRFDSENAEMSTLPPMSAFRIRRAVEKIP